MKIIQPPNWPRGKGYAHAVESQGRFLCLSGVIGWDEAGNFASDDFVEQTRVAFQNIITLLNEANASPQHITRMTWYVVDKREYLSASHKLGQLYREFFGQHYPAMTAVQVSALMEDRARVEIEVTAILPD